MIDVMNGQSCFRFNFIFGEPDVIIANITSERVYFESSYDFRILPGYSTFVGAGKYFKTPLAISVIQLIINSLVSNEYCRCFTSNFNGIYSIAV